MENDLGELLQEIGEVILRQREDIDALKARATQLEIENAALIASLNEVSEHVDEHTDILAHSAILEREYNGRLERPILEADYSQISVGWKQKLGLASGTPKDESN